MITIGYSTRNTNPNFQEYLKKSSGNPKTEIIEKVNNGEKSLSQTYNEIISESSNEIIVLCHDDIYFDTKNWGPKLEKLFERNPEFGIIGVAGTTNLPKSGMWWEDRSKMWGIVNHEHEGRKWESKYSDSLNNELKEVVLVDGLFIAINKKNIKKNFDESVSGFHFYDVNFSFNNFIDGVKIGVTTSIRITHKSIGMTSDSWEENRKIFIDKNRDLLPVNVKISNKDILNFLFCCEELTNNPNGEELLKIAKNFKKHKNSFLSVKISPEKTSYLKKENIKYHPINKPPGFMLGDGKSIISTPNGREVSNPNQFYKISEEKIDVIFCSDSQTMRIINMLYPLNQKILIQTDEFSSMNNFVTDENVIGFINKTTQTIETNKLINFEIDETNIVEIINSKHSNNKQKIKIVTGFSDKGGSTTAFVNLTNELNKYNFDCTLYGPHTWHLDKCKSSMINNLKIDNDDILICHFLDLQDRPEAKKVILSCHEKNLFKVAEKKQFWDVAVFINQEHKDYHSNYKGEYTLIPNLKENLKPSNKNGLEKIAAVIGSIDENKQTHLSIQRAINDGCEKIYIFGQVTEPSYFKTYVEHLIDNQRVVFYGVHEKKQEMYDMIGKVYHSSISEVACLVKDECYLTNTEFIGSKSTETQISTLTNEEVINKWIELFNI